MPRGTLIDELNQRSACTLESWGYVLDRSVLYPVAFPLFKFTKYHCERHVESLTYCNDTPIWTYTTYVYARLPAYQIEDYTYQGNMSTVKSIS